MLLKTVLPTIIFWAILWPTAALPQNKVPTIAIIIDDLGDNLQRDLQVLDLPGDVSVSILPHTPHSVELALLAQQQGTDTLLHLPMEAMSGKFPGPGTIKVSMPGNEIKATVARDIASIPNIVGLNNHMGSLATTEATIMLKVMQEIKKHEALFYIDSLTTANSVAAIMAQQNQIPFAVRDVFLDTDPSLQAIDFQFKRMVRMARKTGYSLAIGHPYATTLEYLSHWIPRLKQLGVKLVPISTYVTIRQQGSSTVWQASLSHSRKIVKN